MLTKEGIAFNVNECLAKVTIPGTTTEAHVRATCFNNCKGKNMAKSHNSLSVSIDYKSSKNIILILI